MPLRIAILASGSGSNAQAFIDKIRQGILDAEIALILSDRADAYVLERARQASIAAHLLKPKDYPCREDHDLALCAILNDAGVEAVVLAGYMRLLSATMFRAFPKPILNIHPALLPSFPGAHGARDALAYGVKISGCSVHFVEEKMDAGPLIIQAALPVLPDDDAQCLLERIHPLEHRIYPQAVQWLAQGRLECRGRKVRLKPSPNMRLAQPRPDCLIEPPLEDGF